MYLQWDNTYWSFGREKKEDSRKGDFFKKTFSTHWAGGEEEFLGGQREVFRGRGRKHGKDQWEKSENTKPVEIFSPEGSVSSFFFFWVPDLAMGGRCCLEVDINNLFVSCKEQKSL